MALASTGSRTAARRRLRVRETRGESGMPHAAISLRARRSKSYHTVIMLRACRRSRVSSILNLRQLVSPPPQSARVVTSSSPSSAATAGAWAIKAAAGHPGVHHLTLDAPPVNALTREVMNELLTRLTMLRGNAACQAVVLSSGRPHIFSAGLNIRACDEEESGARASARGACAAAASLSRSTHQLRTSLSLSADELYNPEPTRLREYLSKVQDVFLALYGFPKPIVAAITGAAPAGGCWLALLVDYRVGVDADRYHIGLNETSLGIIAPFYFAEPLVHLVGHRQADRMLQLGLLLPPREALRVGLLDELQPTAAAAEAAAEEAAGRYADVHAEARTLTKVGLRRALVERLFKEREQELEAFALMILRPNVQKAVGDYLQRLSNKKRKA